jgi:hypothetical protein
MTNSIEYVNPDVVYPIENWYRTCFLKNIITNPQIIVGDYTYYDDAQDVYNFEKNVVYLFDFMSYCQMLCMKKIRQHIFSHLSYRY